MIIYFLDFHHIYWCRILVSNTVSKASRPSLGSVHRDLTTQRTFHQPAQVPIQTYWQYVWYSIALKTINHLMFCLKRLVCAHKVTCDAWQAQRNILPRSSGVFEAQGEEYSQWMPTPMVRNSAFLKCLASLDISWVLLNWSIPTTGYPMCTVYIYYIHRLYIINHIHRLYIYIYIYIYS